MSNVRYHKTRIAPTPSGYLHAGNIYSFLITTALARQTGAKLLLRIDDLDQQRAAREYVEDIFDTLRFLKISWSEGPQTPEEFYGHYSQMHRINAYQEALNRLVELDAVYACTCSRSDILRSGGGGIYHGVCRNKNIPLDAPGVCWRLKTEPGSSVLMKEVNGDVAEHCFPETMRDFIVRKKDGYPSYQLASVVDDLYFGVDLIVRGADLFDSTLAQLYLSLVLNNRFGQTAFYHHELITEKGSKLSKSAGAGSLKDLRNRGYSPSEILTMLRGLVGSQGLELPFGHDE